MRTILFLLINLSLFCTQVYGSRFYFNHLDINNGLSQNTVNAILQDRNGFMWFGTKDGLNRYDGLTFQTFKREPNNGNGLGNDYIVALHEDPEGNIWIATDSGIYIYYPEEETFRYFPLYDHRGNEIKDQTITQLTGSKEGIIYMVVHAMGVARHDIYSGETSFFNIYDSVGNIRSLTVDRDGTVWIGPYTSGLYFSTDNLVTLEPFLSSEGEVIFPGSVISKIYFCDYNRLFLGFEGFGLVEINLLTQKVKKVKITENLYDYLFVRDIISYSEEELWIATETGFYIYNIRTKEIANIRRSVFDPYSLSDNAIYSLYKDTEGGMWLGTFFGGVNYLPKQYTFFNKYYDTGREDELRGKRIREICESSDGILWIGTEDAGLYYFDPQTGKFTFFKPSEEFSNIHGLCFDGDDLWVGSFAQGLRIINTKTKEVRQHPCPERYVFTIHKTKGGDMYLGTSYGLHRYDRQSDSFHRIPEIPGDILAYDVKEDSSGNLWIATFEAGAFKYNPEKNQWWRFLHDEEDERSLPYNKVTSIFEDSRKQVWLTTQGAGFCKYDPETNTFTKYDSMNGMPNNVVYQIVEDNKGLFWITTNKGLVKFDPKEGMVQEVYTVANGLLTNQFNYKSGHKTGFDDIYLGSIDGLISFNPNTFEENNFIPPVYITDFHLFNKKVMVGDKGSPLKKSITFSDAILLKHTQNSFSLRIAALSYQAPQMNQLKYKLDGFDTDWIDYASDGSMITYSNINYGNHTLRVRGSNSDGVWNEEERVLHIRINPPFYLSGFAYCFYFLLFAGFIVLIVMLQRKRVENKQHRHIQLFEQQKERELYDTKINFFTSVAHEIRTPLTLIKGPLDSILQKNRFDPDTEEDLNLMKQNTDRLLNLTNQLLDFRKTENENITLSFSEYNISTILEETFLRFGSLAKQYNRKYTLHVEVPDFHAHVNKEAFIKILSNLFNNALKYSETFISVHLHVEEGVFKVEVVNDGEVIPMEVRDNIFQPFFRYLHDSKGSVPGTGLGLPLCKSLAELHLGSLQMDSDLAFNRFVLTLPIHQQSVIKLNQENKGMRALIAEDSFEMPPKDHSYTILVVEDNPEMAAFIKKQLSEKYFILTAEDGVEALNVLGKQYVNLIISDIAMPRMDGFELCRTVKSDVNYSHIPIILLTAKTNLQSKIEGMGLGADIYMEKPFSTEYLQTVIVNLIVNREKLRESFNKNPLIIANMMATTKADTEFLEKLQEIIHANLSNPNFTMETIAEILHMSKSSFYRKIKGVLDMGPNDYLRLERLKVAARLLKENKYQINEICYMVGFSSSSYFSKCFYKQFGVLPKDFNPSAS